MFLCFSHVFVFGTHNRNFCHQFTLGNEHRNSAVERHGQSPCIYGRQFYRYFLRVSDVDFNHLWNTWSDGEELGFHKVVYLDDALLHSVKLNHNCFCLHGHRMRFDLSMLCVLLSKQIYFVWYYDSDFNYFGSFNQHYVKNEKNN